MNIRGSGYIGTSKIETTTVANTELVPNEPKITPYGRCVFYKISFNNTQVCTVLINNSTLIHLEPNQGFESVNGDALITSFKIVEVGISYQFIAGY